MSVVVVVTACPVPNRRAEVIAAFEDAITLKGAALAGLRAALQGRLSRDLDSQVLAPHPAGDPRKGAL